MSALISVKMSAKSKNLSTRLGAIMLYALIGGLSGLLETIIAYILGRNIVIHNLALSFTINGLAFTVVGAGVIMSLTFSVPELSGKVGKALSGGMVAGFLAGLFFHFGIGLYIGIVILSAATAFLIKMLGAPHSERIFIGGVLGGYGSIFLSIIFMSDQPTWVFTTLSTATIIYFITFGMLASRTLIPSSPSQ